MSKLMTKIKHKIGLLLRFWIARKWHKLWFTDDEAPKFICRVHEIRNSIYLGILQAKYPSYGQKLMWLITVRACQDQEERTKNGHETTYEITG